MKRFRSSAILLLLPAVLLLVSCGNNATPGSNPVVPSGSFSNASLKGSYVFTAAGTDPTDGDYFVAGSLQADGAGNVTGIEDVNLGSGVDSAVPVTGTYLVDSTGHGAFTLNDVNGFRDSVLIQLSNSGASTVTDFDTSGGTGTFESQNLAGFVRSGSYTFQLSGSDLTGALTVTGAFNVDSLGNVSGGTQTLVGAGNTTTTTFSGVMQVAFDGGRGRIILGSNSFSYYVVNANRIILTGLDQNTFLHGDSKK